jgi:hypothetical protein
MKSDASWLVMGIDISLKQKCALTYLEQYSVVLHSYNITNFAIQTLLSTLRNLRESVTMDLCVFLTASHLERCLDLSLTNVTEFRGRVVNIAASYS